MDILVYQTDFVRNSLNLKTKSKYSRRFSVRMIKLMATKPMIFLSIVFAFTGPSTLNDNVSQFTNLGSHLGLELTFFSGVYGTSIADTLAIPSHKKLLALNAIFVGIGEILGILKRE